MTMTTTSAKIWTARRKWKCSFTQIAFLLDLPKTEVLRLYHEYEAELKKTHSIGLDDSVSVLNLPVLDTNQLKRHGIYTVRQALDLTQSRVEGWRGCGVAITRRILSCIQKLRAVLLGEE